MVDWSRILLREGHVKFPTDYKPTYENGYCNIVFSFIIKPHINYPPQEIRWKKYKPLLFGIEQIFGETAIEYFHNGTKTKLTGIDIICYEPTGLALEYLKRMRKDAVNDLVTAVIRQTREFFAGLGTEAICVYVFEPGEEDSISYTAAHLGEPNTWNIRLEGKTVSTVTSPGKKPLPNKHGWALNQDKL